MVNMFPPPQRLSNAAPQRSVLAPAAHTVVMAAHGAIWRNHA